MAPIYLDHNATAPLRPEAAEAMLRAMGTAGNPSSVHGFGRAARRILEEAREAVATLVGADTAGVIFTSGGTEANALALAAFGRRRVLVSAVEHPSVLKAGACETVPVDRDGLVDLEALAAMLSAADEPALVAVMLANNETGVMQPIAEVARIAHAHGALVHCDAVQAAGRIPVDLARLGVDSLALSAHKFGGPMGAGALALVDPLALFAPLLRGGAPEGRRRAGTENVPAIAGFGAAALVVRRGMADEAARLEALRDRLERNAAIAAPSLKVFGAGVARLPNTSCLAVPGMSARTAVMALDLAGVAVSAGSACSSGRVDESHVLAAMGAGALAGSAIRVSLGWNTVAADIDGFAGAFATLMRRIGDAVATAA